MSSEIEKSTVVAVADAVVGVEQAEIVAGAGVGVPVAAVVKMSTHPTVETASSSRSL